MQVNQNYCKINMTFLKVVMGLKVMINNEKTG